MNTYGIGATIMKVKINRHAAKALKKMLGGPEARGEIVPCVCNKYAWRPCPL